MPTHLLEDLSGCKGESKRRMLTTVGVKALISTLTIIAAILSSLGVISYWMSALPLRFQATDARLAVIEKRLTGIEDYVQDEAARRESIAAFESKVDDQ